MWLNIPTVQQGKVLPPPQPLPHTCPLPAFTRHRLRPRADPAAPIFSAYRRGTLRPCRKCSKLGGVSLLSSIGTGRQDPRSSPGPPSWAHPLTHTPAHITAPQGRGQAPDFSSYPCCLAVGSNLGLQEWGRTSRDTRTGAERNGQRN